MICHMETSNVVSNEKEVPLMKLIIKESTTDLR